MSAAFLCAIGVTSFVLARRTSFFSSEVLLVVIGISSFATAAVLSYGRSM